MNPFECIAEHVERDLGCRINWHDFPRGPSHPQLPDCATAEQYGRLTNWTEEISHMDEAKVHQTMGCSAPCQKTEYTIKFLTELRSDDDYPRDKLKLRFVVRTGRYETNRQYVIYDTNAFIADTGGYLGLLLGFSLMGLFQSLCQYLPSQSIAKSLKARRKRKSLAMGDQMHYIK